MDDERANKIAQQKNIEAWDSLKRFAQPLCVIALIGSSISKINNRQFENNLIQPMLSFPLASLALAACVNVNEPDFKERLKNYVFYFCKGVLVSLAILLSDPSEFFFESLNDGWLKNVFTGNLLHKIHGTGFRTLVFFHTLNLFLNQHIVQFAYNTF